MHQTSAPGRPPLQRPPLRLCPSRPKHERPVPTQRFAATGLLLGLAVCSQPLQLVAQESAPESPSTIASPEPLSTGSPDTHSNAAPPPLSSPADQVAPDPSESSTIALPAQEEETRSEQQLLDTALQAQREGDYYWAGRHFEQLLELTQSPATAARAL